MAKKDIGIARPILTRRCKRCGKFWTACHPKDDRELCERCREWKENVATADGGTRKV